MTKVNHGEGQVMPAKKVSIFAIIADQQSAKLVNPGKTTLTDEASLVNTSIEEAFASAFRQFAVALIVGNIGDQSVIEADFAPSAGIESTVGVEKSGNYRQSQSFQGLKGCLEMGFQTKGIMMVARHNARASHHITLTIGDGQNIAGFGALAPLIGHTLTAFLSDSMATIQVQLGQVEVITDRLDTVLPNLLQTAVGAPFLPVVVDRLPTDFFFSGSPGSAAMGSCAH